jgi:hypothetical protein
VRLIDGNWPAHVFVTRGKIENFVHDAVIVPTDRAFNVERHWNPVLGLNEREDAGALRPEGWLTGRGGRARGRSAVWFIDVGRDRGERVEWLAEGVCEVLHDVADQDLEPSRGRVRPLVVMPMVGIGRGGFGRERGEAIKAVLRAAQDVAGDRGLDVAFVVRDRAAYAAVQHLRRQRPCWPLGEELVSTAEGLGRRAMSGELALFLGAGVSIPAGLPSWAALVGKALEQLEDTELITDARQLTLLDQAELVSRQNPEALRQLVVDECDMSQHALSHALLSSLGCREVVTTNFDRCFELADADGHVRVLPRNAPDSQAPWLLKMHGDVGHPQSIVLTRGDFAAYDSKYRPAASVLQALILTRHVLFVGASMTDDNVLRLAYEVSRLREDNRLPGHWGTVLDVGDSAAKKALYARELDWVTFAGGSTEDRARQLEIFLDAVACYASSDSSWLLDEDFSMLLDDGGPVAEHLRDITSDVERLTEQNPAWSGLLQALRNHGA